MMKQLQIKNQYKTARAPSFVIEGNFVSTKRVRESGGKYSTSKKQSQDGANTPPHIVELVIQVLGAIDLDPCADKGKHIPARQHYTAADDGLQKQWNGRLFINPPQECPGLWVRKLQEEIQSSRVTEAIALVAAATDTDWLSELLAAQPVCFWRGKIQFLDADYLPTAPAQQSYVLVYWGLWGARFKEVFEEYGVFKPSIYSNTYNRDTDQVLGENISQSISPSTQEEHDTQTNEDSLLQLIPLNGQLSNQPQVLGENILQSISPSTQEEHDTQTNEDSLLQLIPLNGQLSNQPQVLGENILHSIPPSTHRKHGEGSGNLSWGYANANSKKKKPIKQLYFEWEYGGMRGKTYVRVHLKEEVIALNEAKAPVIEILELLTYNPKVAKALGI